MLYCFFPGSAEQGGIVVDVPSIKRPEGVALYVVLGICKVRKYLRRPSGSRCDVIFFYDICRQPESRYFQETVCKFRPRKTNKEMISLGLNARRSHVEYLVQRHGLAILVDVG